MKILILILLIACCFHDNLTVKLDNQECIDSCIKSLNYAFKDGARREFVIEYCNEAANIGNKLLCDPEMLFTPWYYNYAKGE